jgi:cyclic pyranopterin phosphate synthase
MTDAETSRTSTDTGASGGSTDAEASGDPAGEPRLTHVDERGAARMVDVSTKDVTVRTATATGRVLVSTDVITALRDSTVPKGDALAVARLAGIQGAKRTPDLVPLCHPIALHGVSVDLVVEDDAVSITATVRTADRTGVEMEALTAVAVAGLALVDMVKAIDKSAAITDVRVEAKTGGHSGDWHRSG